MDKDRIEVFFASYRSSLFAPACASTCPLFDMHFSPHHTMFRKDWFGSFLELSQSAKIYEFRRYFFNCHTDLLLRKLGQKLICNGVILSWRKLYVWNVDWDGSISITSS